MAITRRSNVSATELMKAIQNSGLPLGDSAMMKNAGIVAPDLIQSQVQQQYNPAIDQAKAKYMNAIKKIADMDGRLAKVYSDPSSSLYMERASNRDAAITGAENVGYKVAGDAMDEIKAAQEEVKNVIADALSVYNEATTATARSETAAKKASKGGSGKKKTKDDQLADTAKVFDPEARILFKSQPAAFKVWMANSTRDAKNEEFSSDDVEAYYQAWVDEKDQLARNKSAKNREIVRNEKTSKSKGLLDAINKVK